MKFTIEQSAFSKALKHVIGVTEKRCNIPVLCNVLIAASGDAVKITATDLDMELSETTDAIVEDAGATTIPAHTLYGIINELPKGSQVQITATDDGKAILTSGSAKFRLGTLPEEDFPRFNTGDVPNTITLAAHALKQLLAKTVYAVSTEETRYYLNGVFLHTPDETTLRAVATDGHRLARYEVTLPSPARIPSIIVPTKAITTIMDMADGSDIELAVSETKIRATTGRQQMASKLIDATYPDYERVIPERGKHVVTTLTAEFGNALNLTSAVLSDKTRAIKMALDTDSITLSTTNQDTASEGENTLHAEYNSSQQIIGFNVSYMRSMLSQIGGKALRITLLDSVSPIRIEDDEDPAALHILMPMRV